MEPAPPQAAAAPARTGLIVFAALVTEIVIIAAACNQWVTVRIGDQLARSAHGSETLNDFRLTLLAFNWRFAPAQNDFGHVWLAQIFMIMALVAVSAILIGALASGPARFARVFLAAWASVVFATVIASYVRGLVNDRIPTSTPRITRALFGTFGPNSFAMVAGTLLGLVAAIVAATVAVKTAPAGAVSEAAAPVESSFFPPEQPPPYYGEEHIAPPWGDQYAPAGGRHAATPLPSTPTTRLPDVEQPGTQPGAEGDQMTTRFPRPPDDDDLGHV